LDERRAGRLLGVKARTGEHQNGEKCTTTHEYDSAGGCGGGESWTIRKGTKERKRATASRGLGHRFRHRLSFLHEIYGQNLHRFLADVLRVMYGRLILECVTGLQCHRLLSLAFDDERAFQHIRELDSRMAVASRRRARSNL